MTTPPPGQALTAETDAAVEAMRGAIEWDKARGYRMPYRVRDPLYAAIDRLASQSTAPTRGEGESPWKAHNPRYGGNFPPVAGDTWVEVKGSLVEPGSPARRAGDVYWGDQSDCDNPVRWYREVTAPTPPEPVASALADGEVMKISDVLAVLRADRLPECSFDNGRNWETDDVLVAEAFSRAADTLEAAAARIAALEDYGRMAAQEAVEYRARADRLAGIVGRCLKALDASRDGGEYPDFEEWETDAREALREPKSGGGA